MADRDQSQIIHSNDGDDGVILHDANGVIVATNLRIESILGYSEAELLGKSLRDIQPEQLRQSDVIGNSLKFDEGNKKVETRASVFQKKDGGRVPATLKSSHIKFLSDGKPQFYVQRVIRVPTPKREPLDDISGSDLSASLAEGDGISFLEILKRELNAPVKEMLTAIRLIEESTPDKAHRALLSLTMRSGGYLVELIQDILELCRLESAPVKPVRHRFNFSQLVDDLFEQVSPEANKKKINMTSYIDSDIPNYCYGDESRIRMVITKVLKNAFVLTEEGSIRFEVRLTNDGRVRFEVLDTGCGIDEEQQALIFKKNIFDDILIDRRYSAVAVGYALARKSVDLMDGCMGYSSLAGSGTLVWCAFDILENQATSEPKRFLDNRRIVVIDGDKSTQEPLSKQLESWGAKVSVYSDQKAAAKYFRDQTADRQTPNLIMLYVHNSDEYDVALIREINDYLVDRNHLDVTDLIVLTPGYFTPDAARHFARVKHTHFRCPYRASNLGNKIARLLRDPEPFEIEQGLKDSPEDLAKSKQEITHSKQYSGSILIVDDGKITQMVTAKFLRKHGFQVTCANNGWDAIYQTESDYFDLILMDVHMPDMDGIEATKRIRQAEKHQRHTPILAITASMDKDVWKKCMFAGMDDYMTKPIDNQVMLATIEYWISEKVLERKSKSESNDDLKDMTSFDSSGSCLNEETVQSLKRDIDEAMLPEVISIFLNDVDQKVSVLHDFIQEDNSQSALDKISEIETECQYMGAEWLKNIMSDLTVFINKHDKKRCELLLEHMPKLIDETSKTYEKVLLDG